MPRPRKREFPSDNPDTIDAVIAAQVTELRGHRGWSQAELGSRINVSGSVVQQLERGGKAFSVEQLLRLAHTLDVSPAELIGASFVEIDGVPLFAGCRVPRDRARAWAAGEPGAALPDMNERNYAEQISEPDSLARRGVSGLEELERLVHELRRAAGKGDEDAIDDCIRALEGQARHVRHMFGRKRGSGRLHTGGHGTAAVVRGDKQTSP